MATSLDKSHQLDFAGLGLKTKDVDISGLLGVAGGTATLVSNAATVTAYSGQITTESLTTAAAASQALVVTLTGLAATDQVQCTFASIPSTGTPVMAAACTSNTLTITLYNKHASAAFNGAFVINYLVNRP